MIVTTTQLHPPARAAPAIRRPVRGHSSVRTCAGTTPSTAAVVGLSSSNSDSMVISVARHTCVVHIPLGNLTYRCSLWPSTCEICKGYLWEDGWTLVRFFCQIWHILGSSTRVISKRYWWEDYVTLIRSLGQIWHILGSSTWVNAKGNWWEDGGTPIYSLVQLCNILGLELEESVKITCEKTVEPLFVLLDKSETF